MLGAATAPGTTRTGGTGPGAGQLLAGPAGLHQVGAPQRGHPRPAPHPAPELTAREPGGEQVRSGEHGVLTGGERVVQRLRGVDVLGHWSTLTLRAEPRWRKRHRLWTTPALWTDQRPGAR